MATAIPADGLTTPDPFGLPTPTQDTTDYNSIISSAIGSIPGQQAIVDGNTAKTQSNINTLTGLQTQDDNRAADQAAANEAAGVNSEKSNLDKYNQDLNDINASVAGLANEAKAIPLKVQQNAANTGATDAGVAPIQTGMLRENAIKALTQSSLADIATANINNSTIRYNAAKDKANQAIDLKYDPIEKQIADIKDQLAINKEYITDPAEKKLAASQETALNERARLLAEQKQNEKDVNDVLLTAVTNEAPQSVIDALKGAKTQSEAIKIAGKYGGDFYKTEALKAQIAQTKAQTAKTISDTQSVDAATQQTQVDSWVKNIQNSGGKLSIKDVPKNIQSLVNIALATGNAENVAVVQGLQQKSNDIAELINDPYLAGSVGPNDFTRFSPLSVFTGGKQNFLAGVSQLTNQETLDKLLQLKASGGTLGALNESEGKMLRDAATKINGWAIKDGNGNVTGYNASESDFKQELGTLQTLTNNAIVNAGGTVANPNNAFSNAIGDTAIPGTSILSGVTSDGHINFSIPK